ncbi:MAG: hypothetical protein OXD35_07610 [Thiotrichales bacterium]|nr:hypothetical protein [Thiotrichales bacterium]
MRLEDEWAANEERLLREAGTLGGLLERIRGLFSPRLIHDREWEGLAGRAAELPPTLAAFPLWLGFPLDEPREGTELCVSVVGGTRSAAFFRDRGSARISRRESIENSDPSTASIASLLEQTGPQDSPLRRVAGDRVLLEHGLDAAKPHRRRGPEVSLYPIRPTLAGDPTGGRLRDLGVALDAIDAATGREPDAAARRQVERVYLALDPHTRIGGIGVLPSQTRGTRLTGLGFVGIRDVAAFLERAEWPGRPGAVVSLLSGLEHRRALDGMHLGVHFEVNADGVGPTLELHVFCRNTMYENQGWFKDKRYWGPLMDGLRQEGLTVPEKLSELAKWSSGSRVLFGRSGPFVALQRIHHFKFVLAEDRIHRIKGHVFLLMCGGGPRPSTGPEGTGSRRSARAR